MNLNDYLKKIENYKRELPEKLSNEIYPKAIEKATRSLKLRIFTRGLDANGNEIGNYSTKEIIVSKNVFVKPSAFKPQRNKKAMKLVNGYKELKQIQNLKSEKVNLVYSGKLKNSLQSNKNIIGFTDSKESEIARNNENRYGKTIFGLSDDEKLKLSRNISSEMRKLQKKYFYAN